MVSGQIDIFAQSEITLNINTHGKMPVQLFQQILKELGPSTVP